MLTGGRAFVTLDLARQFARQGHSVIIAESVPVHLCRYSRCVQRCYLVPPPRHQPEAYIDALVRIIQDEKIDLLIPTCEEIFYLASGLERLRACCAVFAAPLAQLERLHSKWDFIQLALRCGLRVPETRLLLSQSEMRQLLASAQRPLVLKPVFSRFATSVVMVEADQSPHSLETLDISARHPWIAQEKIEGQAFCSYSVAREGKLLAHVVYAGDFTAGGGACIQFSPVEHAGINDWIERFVAAEGFSGQIAFDFIVTAAGEVYPLECNPRATSGIHLFQGDRQLPAVFLTPISRENPPLLRPAASTRAMIAPAMLVYALPAVRSWRGFKAWLRAFAISRDVIFDLRDPGPFLCQLLVLWYNWRGSRALGISLPAFSTIDIEWNGPESERVGSLP